MAITQCTECGKPVSEYAAKCPHCGIQHPTLPSWVNGVISLIAIAFAIYVTTVMWQGCQQAQRAFDEINAVRPATSH